MSNYTVTDQQLLEEIQYTLLETPNAGASMTTSCWTIPEIAQYVNDRQRHLVKETGIVAKEAQVSGTIGVKRYRKPSDCITIRRLTWYDTLTATLKSLARTDAWASTNLLHLTTPSIPKIYLETATPDGQFEIDPTALRPGYFRMVYLAHEGVLSNTGVPLTVPDEFAPYVKYGALADCWKKAGAGQDLMRAGYCEERFDEGIEVGKALMSHGGTNG